MEAERAAQADATLSYDGETLARDPRVATALALLCPGLAYLYVGRLMRGIITNLLFLLGVEAFVIAQYMLKFFPLLPLLVFVVGWLVMALLVAADARDIIAREGWAEGDYLLRAHNHWLPYTLVAVFSFALPIGASVKVVADHLWLAAALPHSGMFPTLLMGDVALIDRGGFATDAPQVGELAAVSAQEDAPVHVLRVVGRGPDVMRVEGDLVYLNEEALVQAPSTLDLSGRLGKMPTRDMMPIEEQNSTVIGPGSCDLSAAETPEVPAAREAAAKAQALSPQLLIRDCPPARAPVSYVITRASNAISLASLPATKLDAQTLIVLSDNRSQVPLHEERAPIRDSRNFGPVSRSHVRGKPLFILWSRDLDTGRVRWDRIGLRIQP